MSNWLKSKCQTIDNIEEKYLDEALARMNMYADFDTKTVSRVFDNNTRPCQALLRDSATNESMHIGLNFEITTDEKGEQKIKLIAVADWWESKFNEKTFMERFTIEYTAVKAIAAAREQGFSVREEITLEDGRRRLTLTRAA